VIFGQASNPLSSTITNLLKPKVKQDDGIYSQPNVDLLSAGTNTFRSPDSNISSDTGNSSIMSMSTSTLPTSEDEDSDGDSTVKSPPKLVETTLSKLVASDGETRQLRSLKRGHSGDDVRCAEHPYRRPRKECNKQQMRVVDYPLEAANCNKSLRLGLSDGIVTSLAEKPNRNGKNMSLRRKGNFIKHNEDGDDVQQSADVAIIQNN